MRFDKAANSERGLARNRCPPRLREPS
ncbi:MAG: hypothetical protein RJB63_491, partial [Actinomycetota bacterium]